MVKTLRDIQNYNDNAKIVMKNLIGLVRGYKEANQNLANELWQNRGVGGGNWEQRKKQIELEMINYLITNEELLQYFQNLLYAQQIT